jgi:hypothetical protein
MAVTFSPLTTTFTTGVQNGISVAGVTNAATAYDWFAASGTGGTAIAAIANVKDKAMAQGIAQQARAALVYMVKAEYVAQQFSSNITLITNNINSIVSTLTSIQDPSFLTSISSLTPSYITALTAIISSLNRMKTLETRIYTNSDSIDITAATTQSNVGSTTTATSFTGAKTYLAGQYDPAVLGNGGTVIPSISSVNNNVGNAAALSTIYNNAATAIAASNVLGKFRAEIETATKAIFDTYAIMASGYASTNTSGTTGTPVGLYAGIDYELSTVGEYQAADNAPGSPVTFWGADHAHTW